MDAQGEVVHVGLLTTQIEDANLGVGNTTVEPRLRVRLEDGLLVAIMMMIKDPPKKGKKKKENNRKRATERKMQHIFMNTRYQDHIVCDISSIVTLS